MHKTAGLLWIVGLFGLMPASNAQTAAPPAANTQFDGTHASSLPRK